MAYTKAELVSAIRSCGVERGDLVMAHVGMSSLRDVPAGVRDQEGLSALCAAALSEAVGPDGILVVPSFTYSLGSGEIYDPSSTPCRNIGHFPEYFRTLPGVVRSRDPFLAVAALGGGAREIISGTSNTSYGRGSFFDKFTRAGGKIVCVGVGIRWATIRYHFDEIGGAPFRYLKVFRGKSMGDGALEEIRWEYSVAPRAPSVDRMSRQQGFIVEDMLGKGTLLKRAPLGKGHVCGIEAGEYKRYILDMLERDPWMSSGGAITSVEQIEAEEKRRTGARSYDVDLSGKTAVEEILQEIERVPREIMSDGYDDVLAALARRFGLKIAAYPTGTRINNFIVPERRHGDLRSYSTLKIGIAPSGAERIDTSRARILDLCGDPRSVVEALLGAEKLHDRSGILIVPDRSAAALVEG